MSARGRISVRTAPGQFSALFFIRRTCSVESLSLRSFAVIVRCHAGKAMSDYAPIH